jgi:thiol-disulfide isomerase/thioredoxin
MTEEMGYEVMNSAAEQADAMVFGEMDKLLTGNKRNKRRLADFYNDFAWNCAEKDTLLTYAAPYSLLSLIILNQLSESLSEKAEGEPAYLYRKKISNDINYYTDTYGFLLYKQGKYDSAAYYLTLAAEGEQWKNEDFNQHCFDAMEKVKPATELVDKFHFAILNDGYHKDMETQYLRVAKAAGISNPAGMLDLKLKKANDKKYGDLKNKMVSKEAPDFLLTDLDGNTVSLKSLKGKTVVLDFWATWCGPCIASFPAMQAVVDIYRGSKEVAIFFVNTWEQKEDKVAYVINFFTNQPYQFQVLLDEQGKVADSFNLKGLPTKLVLDKTGKIRFSILGYDKNMLRTIEKMRMMVDLAGQTD